VTQHDLIMWRQHMMTRGGLKAASVNRRPEAVRRLLHWAEANGTVERNVAVKVKSVRVIRERRPLGLMAAEVHSLLRAAGESSHGLARRNYALVQLTLQTGLRVGEVAALRRNDIVLRERTGTVRVRHGEGLKERGVPLNATARRALRQLLEQEPSAQADAAVFKSGRSTAMPVRSIQNVIAALVRRAGLTTSEVSAHRLRHTFPLAWPRQHLGRLVELAQLLDHMKASTPPRSTHTPQLMFCASSSAGSTLRATRARAAMGLPRSMRQIASIAWCVSPAVMPPCRPKP
jgi:site-specific recombinase XerD